MFLHVSNESKVVLFRFLEKKCFRKGVWTNFYYVNTKLKQLELSASHENLKSHVL